MYVFLNVLLAPEACTSNKRSACGFKHGLPYFGAHPFLVALAWHGSCRSCKPLFGGPFTHHISAMAWLPWVPCAYPLDYSFSTCFPLTSALMGRDLLQACFLKMFCVLSCGCLPCCLPVMLSTCVHCLLAMLSCFACCSILGAGFSLLYLSAFMLLLQCLVCHPAVAAVCLRCWTWQSNSVFAIDGVTFHVVVHSAYHRLLRLQRTAVPPPFVTYHVIAVSKSSCLARYHACDGAASIRLGLQLVRHEYLTAACLEWNCVRSSTQHKCKTR